jgi:hypothetical protein
MDIPDSNRTTEIARTYLKQLGSTGEVIQKPEVRAWLELEQRLMLGSEPNKPQEVRPTAPSRNPTISKTPQKVQSIWKRPISELWR